MILRDRPRILPAEVFVKGLERSRHVVLRVLVGKGVMHGAATCTAWLVTPRIVVAPGYLLMNATEPGDPASWITVQSTRAGRISTRRLIPGGVEVLGEDRRSIAMLKLEASAGVVDIELGGPMPEQGSMTSLLSYPRGGTVLGFSIGTLLSVDDFRLTYDADSEGGSGGGPLFDEGWRLIGMHMAADSAGKYNEGISRTELIALMRRSALWPEVARHHKLANVRSTRGPDAPAESAAQSPGSDEPLRLRAAATLHLQRSRLTTGQREQLEDLVIDAEAKLWTLQPAVRREIIQRAGSLESLRRHAPRGRSANAGQQVIARILAGPDYELESANEDQLSWWLQAVRWFEGVAPDLPSAVEVNRLLQRRRVRSQLARVAGPDFAGRSAELKRLGAWFRSEPATAMSLTGVGGVGKSALVARFAQQLPADTLLLWLDFDRPDLAPDDAMSVVDALHSQAQRQVDVSLPKRDPAASWKIASSALAGAMAKLELASPPLLVLDSFEVAQYAQRYQELWPVLERIAKRMPTLRVIVSGRAPVPGLEWQGRPVQSMQLSGLRKPDARAWLQKHGIRTEKSIDTVFSLSRGLPLILRLAHRYVETGGRLASLPKDLPSRIRAGFLYARILDRVYDAALKPLATGVLVLRRVTVDMLDPIFKGLVKPPPGKPADWFAQLRREAAFVEGSDVLQVRQELRAAALEFIEACTDDIDVHQIEQRAIAWYRTQDIGKPELAAELVYHLLRNGDISGAHAAWRGGCEAYLQHADDTLKPKARSWLRQRLGVDRLEDTPVELWEFDAADRVRALNSRGLGGVVSGVLGERGERSADSPLVFHDALALNAAGERDNAIALLGAAPSAASASVRRERALLAALLHAEAGRRMQADELLAPLDRDEAWVDRKDGALERAALCAARIRLTVDLEAEKGLLAEPAGRSWLMPMDAVLPALADQLAATGRLSDRQWVFRLPSRDEKHIEFLMKFLKSREALAPQSPDWMEKVFLNAVAGVTTPPPHDWPADASEVVWTLLVGSLRRWALMLHGRLFTVLPRMLEARALSPLQAAVLGSQALFAALRGVTLEIVDDGSPKLQPVTPMVLDLIERNLTRWLKPELLKELQGTQFKGMTAVLRSNSDSFTGRFTQRTHAVAFFQSVPDPLVVLVDRFAGKPQQESSHG